MRRTGVAAAIGGLLALVLTAPAGAQQKAPAGFVSLKAEVPSIKVEMRYITAHNFIGRPIRGYRDPLCIVTRPTAAALGRAQAAVRRAGYTLKVYDCYRPQRAVDDFVAWGKNLRDQKMKAEFYPRVDKRRVFKEG